MIDTEVFCEGHKEGIIEAFGIDHFLPASLPGPTRYSVQVAASRMDARGNKRREAVMPQRSELRSH
jgi:hypothetical protein